MWKYICFQKGQQWCYEEEQLIFDQGQRRTSNLKEKSWGKIGNIQENYQLEGGYAQSWVLKAGITFRKFELEVKRIKCWGQEERSENKASFESSGRVHQVDQHFEGKSWNQAQNHKRSEELYVRLWGATPEKK